MSASLRTLDAEKSYDRLYHSFSWKLPRRLNMAEQCLAGPGDRVAIVELSPTARKTFTVADLEDMSARLAGRLASRGVVEGDRVGVLRGQGAWCAAAHLAIWRVGAISVPLFKLFKHDALKTRIETAGCKFVVTDKDGRELLGALAVPVLPETDLSDCKKTDISVTGPDTPAVLIFTSGTTGAPKGALHGHRMLMGHLPGVEMSHNFLGQPGDVLWTPADWAWIGGLFDVLMPGLALQVPVVAARADKFSPEACVDIIRRGSVRNVFFPPTALRMLKASDVSLSGLRTVASGGEPLGAEMLGWGREALGVTINEFYGQTECNMVASSCSALFEPQPAAIGRAVPGYELAVINEDGQASDGEGDIAVRKGCASMMLEYWENPQATAEKFRGDWLVTGDRGIIENGSLRFVGREDDVITSAGYRIGPAEIEDCLLTHPAVSTVGVVGKPDAVRTEIVKAFVVLKSKAYVEADELKNWVKERLASYSYPREIEFVDCLPMTVTGKVIRKELKARAAAEDWK